MADDQSKKQKRKKRRFKDHERYAIWLCNEQRCWRCYRPLRLYNADVDHVFAESLLWNPEKRAEALEEFGLSDSFDIDGFENWLPICSKCNSKKGTDRPEFVPGNVKRIRQLIRDSGNTKRVAKSISLNVTKDKILQTVLSGLMKQEISMADLEEFLISLIQQPERAGVPEDAMFLDSGILHKKQDFVRECDCTCGRAACVDQDKRIHCYFHKGLSDWVVATGLFWKCYDEVVRCNRCGEEHIRGHIGRQDYCTNPYKNQSAQTD